MINKGVVFKMEPHRPDSSVMNQTVHVVTRLANSFTAVIAVVLTVC